MTKDNEDALEVALAIQCFEGCECPKNEAAAHLRRLVQENEELRADVEHKDAFATQLGRDLMAAQREIEAKDALLRQAVEALEEARTFVGAWPAGAATMAAIRQHLEGRA